MSLWAAAVLQATSTTASTTASSTPRGLAYLPEAHTDFIFSVGPDGFSIVRLAVLVVLLLTFFYVLRRRRAGRRSGSE